MSREFRVFVSLIVWLLSITGRDGLISTRPSNQVALVGNTVTFECISDLNYPVWQERKSYQKNVVSVVRRGCVSQRSPDYIVGSGKEDLIYTCNLIIKPTAPVFSDRISTFFTCEDYDDISGEKDTTATPILIVLRSRLICGMKDNLLSCKLQHSAYWNTSIMLQYLEIRLDLKNPMGVVVSNKTAGFSEDNTVVTATLDEKIRTTDPSTCSAIFKERCDDQYADECVEKVNIVPPDAAECKCRYGDWNEAQPEKTKPINRGPAAKTSRPTYVGSANINDEDDEEEDEDSYEEKVAVIIRNGTAIIQHPGSSAKLERDGIKAIAMLTCLLVAFLVH